MIEQLLFSDEWKAMESVELIQYLIVSLINLAYVSGVIMFFFMLILGGIEWIISGGNKARLSNARDRITHALLGLVVQMSVFAIVRLIETIFSINILVIDIESLKI